MASEHPKSAQGRSLPRAGSPLSVAVRKRRRLITGPKGGAKKFDIDQLIEDVKEAYEEYPPETLQSIWEHKSYVMIEVQRTKPKPGGSNYPKHDQSKRRRL